jgi:hypothetical protein
VVPAVSRTGNEATELQSYQPIVIDELLQIPSTLAHFNMPVGASEDEVEHEVAARLERQ